MCLNVNILRPLKLLSSCRAAPGTKKIGCPEVLRGISLGKAVRPLVQKLQNASRHHCRLLLLALLISLIYTILILILMYI